MNMLGEWTNELDKKNIDGENLDRITKDLFKQYNGKESDNIVFEMFFIFQNISVFPILKSRMSYNFYFKMYVFCYSLQNTIFLYFIFLGIRKLPILFWIGLNINYLIFYRSKFVEYTAPLGTPLFVGWITKVNKKNKALKIFHVSSSWKGK